jgi:hypothetical protein
MLPYLSVFQYKIKGLYAQLGHGLDDLVVFARFPAREGDFSFL